MSDNVSSSSNLHCRDKQSHIDKKHFKISYEDKKAYFHPRSHPNSEIGVIADSYIYSTKKLKLIFHD